MKGYQRKIIGTAVVRGAIREIVHIDKSRLIEENVIRVIYRDKQDRRVTAFIREEALRNEETS